jgi:hypothetical protein
MAFFSFLYSPPERFDRFRGRKTQDSGFGQEQVAQREQLPSSL